MSYTFKLNPVVPPGFFGNRTARRRRFHRRIDLGDIHVGILTGSAQAGNDSTAIRRFSCVAQRGRERVFLGRGFTAWPLIPATTEIVFHAVDKVGAQESGAMLQLLTQYGADELLRDKALVVVTAWESPTPHTSARVIDQIAKYFRTQTVALTIDSLKYEFAPRPEAPSRQHAAYRAALDARLPTVIAVTERMSAEVFPFLMPFVRTRHEQYCDREYRFVDPTTI